MFSNWGQISILFDKRVKTRNLTPGGEGGAAPMVKMRWTDPSPTTPSGAAALSAPTVEQLTGAEFACSILTSRLTAKKVPCEIGQRGQRRLLTGGPLVQLTIR